MERYLDLEHELYGTEAAVNTLKLYLEKNPNHLPAHRLSYHFYKNKIPNSNRNQVEALKVGLKFLCFTIIEIYK